MTNLKCLTIYSFTNICVNIPVTPIQKEYIPFHQPPTMWFYHSYKLDNGRLFQYQSLFIQLKTCNVFQMISINHPHGDFITIFSEIKKTIHNPELFMDRKRKPFTTTLGPVWLHMAKNYMCPYSKDVWLRHYNRHALI